MRTEDLAALLGRDVRAVRTGAVQRRVGLSVLAGGAVTMALVAAWLGLRPDIERAVFGFTFWMKWGYTISIGAIALLATTHLARPEARTPDRLWWLVVPAIVLAALTVVQVWSMRPGEWTALWQGQSWRECTIKVATLSLPIFGALMIAFRSFAPTRLRLTGAVAGLAAGGWAATLYGLHCPEVSALFILIWYSLGMIAASVIGALLGPRLLRW